MGLEMLFSTRLAAEVAVQVLVKGTLLLTAAGLAVTLLRRGSPGQRHAIWSAAFALALLLPVAGVVLPLPTRHLDLFQAPAELTTVTTEPAGPLARPDGPPERGPVPTSAGSARSVSDAESGAGAGPGWTSSLPSLEPGTWAVGFTVLWGAGVLLLAVRLAGHWVRIAGVTATGRTAGPEEPVARLVRDEAARMGVRRRVDVVWSARLGVPATGGLLRPVLILPPDAAGWPEPRLRAVVLHELAHVRRWDLLAHQLAEVARVIYWINPLLWLAHRMAADERERACDREVLGRGIPGPEYAGILVDMAKRCRTPSPTLDGSLAMSRPGRTLRRRVMAVLDGAERRAVPGWAAVAVGALVAVAAVPLATVQVLAVPSSDGSVAAVAEALARGSLEERLRAARSLAQWCQTEATEALTRALSGDPDPDVRTAAAMSLGWHGGTTALGALVESASDRRTPARVRRAAADALGFVGDGNARVTASARDALAGLLEDPDAGVRRLAVNGLGRTAGGPRPELVDGLARVLLDDPEPMNRRAAATVLHRLACESAIPMLQEAYRTDPSAGLRAHVGELLGAHEAVPAAGPEDWVGRPPTV